VIDQQSAVVILESYLEAKENSTMIEIKDNTMIVTHEDGSERIAEDSLLLQQP
jgi:hypothetical protein